MAARPTIDCWLSLGITYTYVSIIRADAVTEAAGATLRWRLFSVRAIMRAIDSRFLAGLPPGSPSSWRGTRSSECRRQRVPR
jgi:hypothetical protein